MRTTTTKDNTTAIIKLYDRFDFPAHRDFGKAFRTALADPQLKNIVFDFRDVTYMDSSALGMLLVARDCAAETKVMISLCNARGTTKSILEIANFHKLFQIT